MQSLRNHTFHFSVSTPKNHSAPKDSREGTNDERDSNLSAFSEPESITCSERLASLSGTIEDIQVNIGKKLEIRDVLRLSQVSKNLHNAMSVVVTDYTTQIRASRTLIPEIIASLSKVKNLSFYLPRPTQEDFRLICQLTNLRGLTLNCNNSGYWGISDFNGLNGLTNLQTLKLSGACITDEVLQHFSGLSNLQNLESVYSSITDEGLQHLSGLSGLQSLDLSATQVTDAGLQHLSGLTNLKSLHLLETPGVSHEGKQKLAHILPQLKFIAAEVQ
jgi:hypothetical protein